MKARIKDLDVSKASDEKFFFHDIKNFVHGLSFFISTKISSQKGLTFSETLGVEKELSSLQNLIEEALNQKKMKHDSKTLGQLLDKLKVDLNFLMVAKYCSKIEFNIDSKVQSVFNQVISYNNFLRIFQNLIFNIAENSYGKDGIIHISYEKGFLRIFTRNKIKKIKNYNKKGYGIGLKSIQKLVDELEGNFTFKKSEQYWENICLLPM